MIFDKDGEIEVGNLLEETSKENQNNGAVNYKKEENNLDAILNKEQILKNIYQSSSVTDEDKDRIEKLFTVFSMKKRNSASDRIQDDIIQKYRPEYFK